MALGLVLLAEFGPRWKLIEEPCYTRWIKHLKKEKGGFVMSGEKAKWGQGHGVKKTKIGLNPFLGLNNTF